MKIYLFLILFASVTVVAQTEKTTLEVLGNCNMCKARIEKAALKTKGVKYAVWQPETQQLALIFNSKKTSSQDVAKNIAAVGHEANGITATEAIYDSLPMCCQYKSVEPHVP